jgi:hypothetical protein
VISPSSAPSARVNWKGVKFCSKKRRAASLSGLLMLAATVQMSRQDSCFSSARQLA